LNAVVAAALLLAAPSDVWNQPARTAPTSTGSDARAAIAGVADAWKSAYNSGDPAGVAALYADDAYYLSAHVLAHGRKQIEAYWQKGIQAGGHIDAIRPLIVYTSGDLGYTAGTYQATNAGVTVDGRVLLVFRRIDGRWLIAAHETVVRDQP
jgi:uncharacterized protein (TIGR02246 family)